MAGLNLLLFFFYLFTATQPVWAGVAVQFFDVENIAIVEGGVKAKVHLACIKAPRIDQPLGRLALQELKELIGGRLQGVKLFRKDRVGRIIGEVYADGENVNLLLVKRGLARFDRQFTYARECKGYQEAEEFAQKYHLGIWQK
ncbi:MAG: thermonuclease family protein [Pseudanabaenaceae cyanobacterium]